ncbi:glycosyltransferase [Leucobacter luti]|uniref:D-inositol 3-phosphate glycosyltransferase n=1 Tax=Leucobacter luti TaxID=340320 RepID=A0A4Q7U3I8_9MICO|nr:glycosyltransferase [Leucobacter luti]MBL3699428.1 glycosyltransferase [Leucobacter luti]RZT66938.1 D-inositol-3-phosphate glycosyltransferase [Leucobacter luti]
MSVTGGPSRLRVGFVMLHTSPLDVPGTKDAGGMNVVVLAQAEALARAGHAIRIFTRRADPAAAARVELTPGLEVVHIDAGPARLLAKAEHEPVMAEFGAQLAAELAREPADVLHAEHWFSGIAALPVARRTGTPLVQSFHSIAVPEGSALPGERPESPGRLAGERRLAREADALIAVSEAERGTIVADLGGAPERVCVVPLGVDTELFRPCHTRECAERDEWFARGGAAEVIAVGRLHPLKGFDLALDALAAIPAARRPALRIVGAPPPDGDDYARGLHEQAARLGLLGSVAFEGALPRPELAARIRRATLMVVPSHTETFGLVALEAAASGVPVVARAAGGLREAVRDGETGVLVRGDDPREWAAVIAALLDDPERMAAMSRAARAHALGRSWGASAESLLAAYRGLLAARAGAGPVVSDGAAGARATRCG